MQLQNKEDKTNNRSKIKQITLIGILVATATVLQIIESPLPRLLPWLKIGLANVLTLYAIIRLRPGIGILVSILRTCLAAFFLGSFLSPIHLISFFGAFGSALIMIFFYKTLPKASLCFISIAGSIASNATQLLVVQLLFASALNFWFYIAMIILVGIPAGLIVGRITYELLRRT